MRVFAPQGRLVANAPSVKTIRRMRKSVGGTRTVRTFSIMVGLNFDFADVRHTLNGRLCANDCAIKVYMSMETILIKSDRGRFVVVHPRSTTEC